MTYETIQFSVSDHVALLTLNRPGALNACNERMVAELLEAFDAVDADDDVRVLVVTGAGRAFCAGADLSGGADTFANTNTAEIVPDAGGTLALRVFACLKPVIAAVNGAAVGIGFTMTLPMDVRVFAAEAKLCLPFVRRGIVPDAASAWFLTQLTGMGTAQDWVCTGRFFTAVEARDAGVAQVVCPQDEVLTRALAIAADIAANASPVSVTLSKQMLWQLAGARHPMEAHVIGSMALADRGRSDDAREGVAAFLEKRPPQFRGRVSQDLPGWFPWWTAPTFEELAPGFLSG